MIALSGPFGTFVANAVKSTTQGLFDVNQNALNSTGLINIDGQEFESCAHDYEVSTIAANCTTAGATTHTCKLCGKSYSEEIQPIGHIFDRAEDMTCNNCNYSFTAYIFDPEVYDAMMGTAITTATHVVIPETFEYDGVCYKVTETASDSFNGYSNKGSWAVSIEFPKSIKSITGIAHITTLKEMIIPASVKSFSSCAFYGCYSMERVYYGGTIEQWNNISKGSYWNRDWNNVEVICTDGTIIIH
jgi:hypothetical protein